MAALMAINRNDLTLLAQEHSGTVSDHTAKRSVRLCFSGLYFEAGYMVDWWERTRNSFVFRTLSASPAIWIKMGGERRGRDAFRARAGENLWTQKEKRVFFLRPRNNAKVRKKVLVWGRRWGNLEIENRIKYAICTTYFQGQMKDWKQSNWSSSGCLQFSAYNSFWTTYICYGCHQAQQNMPWISSHGGADTTWCYNIWQQGASISAKTIFCKSSIYDASCWFFLAPVAIVSDTEMLGKVKVVLSIDTLPLSPVS